jgi:predicted O-methyltransferase YrrM
MVDNVLAAGRVLEDGENADEFARDSVAAIRRVNDLITADERVETVMLGVADGVMLARKR